MSLLELNGARLFFTDAGSGDPPIVFVHGFACDSHDWSWQLPHFVRSHRVIAVDLRGHGRSDSPSDGYELGSLADDIATLIDHVACGPVVAVGHSLGAAIVATLAVERPTMVRAVVAIDAGYLLPDENTPPLIAEALHAYETSDPGSVIAGMFDAYTPATTPPELTTWHSRRALGCPAHALRQIAVDLIGGPRPFVLRANSEPYLSRIDQPVLTINVDPIQARAAAEVFVGSGSTTLCFEGAGHWLHQERPAETNAAIDAWLARLTPYHVGLREK